MSDLESFADFVNQQVNEVVRWSWWYITEISCQLVVAFVAYLVVCVFLYTILKRVSHRSWQLPGPPSRILLVIAHPDDEVMLFGPMLYSLTSLKASEVYLLCFSMGGDRRRKEELWSCAKILGIPESSVTMLMASELPDDPRVQWPSDLVAKHILQHVETYKINAVVTFDKHGVSGHKNHISVFYGVALMCIEGTVPSYCKLYVLETVNRIRKYVQLLDLPISLISSSYWYLITYEQRKIIKKAMAAHRSQYVWFRKLYMIFSRYTLINTLQEVNALDLELDLQFDDD